LVAASPGEVRVAAWQPQDGLVDYAIWRPGAPDGVGDLHRGRVIARVPAMAGAFVALDGADGFLPDSEGGAAATDGTILGVRITRAAQGGKGPRLTARLSDAERALVGAGPPALLRRGPDAVQRLAALHPDAPLERAEKFADEVETEVAALAEPTADLPGGARLSVFPTPALTALDVDLAGATTDRRAKRAMQLSANAALLPAVARQIRLRNLGGAILLDLAGIPAKRRAALGPALAAALAPDPLRPRFLGFTALGLAEILRPRIHPPLHELLAGPHAAGLAALRRAAAEIAARPAVALRLCAAPAVVDALRADPVALTELARRAGRPLTLRDDRAMASPGWRLEEVSGG